MAFGLYLAVCKTHAISIEYKVLPRDGIRLWHQHKLPEALNEYRVDAPVEQQMDFLTSHQNKRQLSPAIVDRML